MTEEEFLEEYNCAPFDERELAEIAQKVTDGKLAEVARNFLTAQSKFNDYLDKIGFEWG